MGASIEKYYSLWETFEGAPFSVKPCEENILGTLFCIFQQLLETHDMSKILPPGQVFKLVNGKANFIL